MERGLYIACSGLLAAQDRVDITSANLANIATSGYKADRAVSESFGDKLLVKMQDGRAIGSFNLGARTAGTFADMTQGPLTGTDAPLDLALAGKGFFSVQLPDGVVAYTRAGQFTRSPEGVLITQQGQPVLDEKRRPIQLPAGGDPHVADDGTISDAAGKPVGRLGVVLLDDRTTRKVGDNLWVGAEIGVVPSTTAVKQGFVEGSNVNSVKEIVELTETMRSFESIQRAVLAIDGTLDKAVNSVGNPNG